MTVPGELTQKQIASGLFSDLVELPVGPDALRCSLIAPEASAEPQPLPTILAISGEEQLHVSLFFRAWRAERRGWQVVAPARQSKDSPYLFEKAGLDLLAKLVRSILKGGECPALHRVEGRKLHLVGTSNGGASVLALAARLPDHIASVTLVTGFVPDCLKDLGPLRCVPRIRLIGSKSDLKTLQIAQDQLELAKAPVDDLQIVKGANHANVGQQLDMEAFWSWLEAGKPKATAESLRQDAVEPLQQKQSAEAGEDTEVVDLRPISSATAAAVGACTSAAGAPQTTMEVAAVAADTEDQNLATASAASSGRRRRQKGKGSKLDAKEA